MQRSDGLIDVCCGALRFEQLPLLVAQRGASGLDVFVEFADAVFERHGARAHLEQLVYGCDEFGVVGVADGFDLRVLFAHKVLEVAQEGILLARLVERLDDGAELLQVLLIGIEVGEERELLQLRFERDERTAWTRDHGGRRLDLGKV